MRYTNYPQWLNYGLSVYYYEKGDYQKALDTILKITQSDWYWLYVNYAAIYGQLGRQEEARDAVDKLNDLTGYPLRSRIPYIWFPRLR